MYCVLFIGSSIPSCWLSINTTWQSCCSNNSWKCVCKPYFFIQFITVESFTLNQQMQIHCWLSNVHVKPVISCYRFQNVYCKRSISMSPHLNQSVMSAELCRIQSFSLFCDTNDYLDLIIHIIIIESFWDTKSVFLDIKIILYFEMLII